MTEKDLLNKLEEHGLSAGEILRAGYGPDKEVLIIGLSNTIHAVEAVLIKGQVVSLTACPYESETERATEKDQKLLQERVDRLISSILCEPKAANA